MSTARWNRRDFLQVSSAAVGAALWDCPATRAEQQPAFRTRGVVLIPDDFSLHDWPERVQRAGLTTIGIHHQHSPQAVVQWVQSEAGAQVLEKCRGLGLQIEYELHAMQELLPRDLFAQNPHFFRMNESGERIPDANCCAHAADALEIIAQSAVRFADVLRPTTGRYYYWSDDAQPWCHCNQCGDLSPSDQVLLIENHILRALKDVDASAQLAHLAYVNTLAPPKHVKPDEGVFLEFAPISRRYDLPIAKQNDAQLADGLKALDANLEIFPKESAQVLEYWLDVSRFARWKRPAVQLPWNKEVLLADLDTYRQKGIQHVTSFAVWIDADYQKRFGDPEFLDDYGAALGGGD